MKTGPCFRQWLSYRVSKRSSLIIFFRKLINILYIERMLMCPLDGYTWAGLKGFGRVCLAHASPLRATRAPCWGGPDAILSWPILSQEWTSDRTGLFRCSPLRIWNWEAGDPQPPLWDIKWKAWELGRGRGCHRAQCPETRRQPGFEQDSATRGRAAEVRGEGQLPQFLVTSQPQPLSLQAAPHPSVVLPWHPHFHQHCFPWVLLICHQKNLDTILSANPGHWGRPAREFFSSL